MLPESLRISLPKHKKAHVIFHDESSGKNVKQNRPGKSKITVRYLSRACGALLDKITVNTDTANLNTAVSIRSFNPGPDRWCAHTGLGTDEQQPPGCQVG